MNKIIQQAAREIAEEKRREKVEEAKNIIRQIEALQAHLAILKGQIKEI